MSFRFVPLLAAALAAGGAALAQPQQQAAVPAGDDPVVARVNGSELRRSDVVAMQHSLPPQVQQMPLEQIYPLLIDQMVNGKLLADAARAAKLDQDAEVKKRVARYEDRVIQEAYISKAVEQASTDEKLRAKYQEFVKEHGPREEVSARHILVDNEAEAKAVIAQLEKGGDFAQLAKQKSKDPAGQNGGDLGFFGREEMVPEFSEAAFKLNKGEFTKIPVKTQFGWHVIKVEDKRQSQPPSFEEAKEELSNDVARDVISDKVKELREKAKVETFALDGSAAPASLPAPTLAPAK
jgi:peptidyl-prolyl cis-trans isomerase C